MEISLNIFFYIYAVALRSGSIVTNKDYTEFCSCETITVEKLQTTQRLKFSNDTSDWVTPKG